jgi:hypothetical protein
VKGPEITLLIVLCAVIVLAVAAALVAGVRCGWIQGSVSLRIVPPWKRKESEPRTKPAAAAEGTEPAAAPVAISDGRRAS